MPTGYMQDQEKELRRRLTLEASHRTQTDESLYGRGIPIPGEAETRLMIGDARKLLRPDRQEEEQQAVTEQILPAGALMGLGPMDKGAYQHLGALDLLLAQADVSDRELRNARTSLQSLESPRLRQQAEAAFIENTTLLSGPMKGLGLMTKGAQVHLEKLNRMLQDTKTVGQELAMELQLVCIALPKLAPQIADICLRLRGLRVVLPDGTLADPTAEGKKEEVRTEKTATEDVGSAPKEHGGEG